MVGILSSRTRVEERLLFDVLEQRAVVFERIDPRRVAFALSNNSGGATPSPG